MGIMGGDLLPLNGYRAKGPVQSDIVTLADGGFVSDAAGRARVAFQVASVVTASRHRL